MKQVRCPACARLHDDPATSFPCAGCGRRLRWSGETPRFVGQLPLFDRPGWQQQELALPAAALPARMSPPQPAPEPSPSLSATPTAFQEAMSLIVACRIGDDAEIIPAVTDLLSGRSSGDLADLVLCCAAITAQLVDAVDAASEGTGTALLQAWALSFASDDEGDDDLGQGG